MQLRKGALAKDALRCEIFEFTCCNKKKPAIMRRLPFNIRNVALPDMNLWAKFKTDFRHKDYFCQQQSRQTFVQ
ncbi:hypothetical protein MAR_003426 [Mya arenaria]|uniref:Uncharacterized protein n=1 Tax=Mya arenaria TaxID=6604 RepID=A0ABY7G9G9_MYAAR|nr:hypothetical protein MAR_003426 [Mya arenaria]